MSHSKIFHNRPALVLGAAAGIGAHVTRRLHHSGAHVVGVDRVEPEDKNRVGGVQYLTLDIVGNEQVILDQTEQLCGGPAEFIVFNAAYQSRQSLLHTTSSDLTRSVELNIVANHTLAALAAQRLVEEKRGGAFVFVLSLHTTQVRGAPAYSGSKAYVNMLIREAAYELAPHHIRVNGISPGIVDEELTENSAIPVGRPVSAAEVANLTMLLLDARATSHVTGANWTVDGGLSLVNWITQQADTVGYLPPDAQRD